jgi:hypothetical protein
MRRYWHPEVASRNPYTLPDWRWQRALDLVATGRSASRKRDDEPTCRAVGFIRRLNRATTEKVTRRVTRQYPDIALAQKLREGDLLCRLELECRVLARQSAGTISRVMQIPRHIVVAYTELFFAIDERIDAKIYIRELIGAPSSTPSPPEAWMRWCAYHRGPATIEPWLDYLQHRDDQHDLSTLDGWRRDAIETFVLAMNLSPTGDDAQKLVKNLPVVIGHWGETRIYASAAEVFRAEMLRTLEELPLAKSEKERPQPAPQPQERRTAAPQPAVGGFRLVG